MTLYLDVAAVRIQRYLSRTPTLRGRRGASAELAVRTRLDDGSPLASVIAGLARRNDEAGVADGVVSLVVADGPQDEDTRARHVARLVLLHLREALPGAEFQAVWGSGEDYLSAYTDQLKKKLEAGDVLADLPAVAEFPAIAPCRFCHSAPATGRLSLDPRNPEEPEQDACADCRMRYSTTVRTTGRTAEHELAEALGLPPSSRARDFAALAELGHPDTGRNHLATVYADGNALGDFFAELAKRPGADKSGISRALSQHTRDALAHAVRTVQEPDDAALCAVPHVVGGDDVLVSLSADRGWRFARAFIDDLCARLAEAAHGHGIGNAPTVSAGIAFARADHPFHLVVEAADECLRRAKSTTAGQAASLDFTDLTQEAGGSPDEPALRFDVLQASAPALDRLAQLPGSARAGLAATLRHGSRGLLQARTDLRTMGREEIAEAFLPRGLPDGEDVEQPGLTLAQALRITRWWR